MIIFYKLAIALVAIALSFSSTKAQTIDCRKIYIVKEGDTLHKIAQRAYGRGSAFQIIFDANRKKISRPGIIVIGLKLWIPCPIEPPPKKPEIEPDTQLSLAISADIEIVTASDYAPFTDETLPNRGMLTEIVERSIKAFDKKSNFRIDFINDWSTHLSILLPLNKYDLGFPWYKPDCSKMAKLRADAINRCKNYNFSDPLYEVVVSYFSLKSNKFKITEASDLKGKTLCRPAGYFTYDLEIRDLVEPHARLEQPKEVDDCFRKLMNGTVQIVTLNTLVADAAIKKMNINDKLTQHQEVATIETLHVVTSKWHARSGPLLLRINQGIRTLKQNGTYAEIIKRHLAPLLE